MRLALWMLLGAILVGCGGPQSPDPSEFYGVPSCGAESLQGLLGEPEAALANVTLPPATRVLRPGDVIALDFSPDRLTIDIDQLGRISSITCR